MNIKLISDKKPPIILFSNKAVRKIRYIVDKVGTEVGWLGTVEKSLQMDPKGAENEWIETYTITDVFVPKQFVAAATCEIKEEGRHDLTKRILEKYGDEEGIKIASSLLFWGHSHVYMSTSPSSQDEAMVMDFKTRDYFIRGIFNKKGEITLDFYDFKRGIQWTDLEPTYETPTLTSEEVKELDDAITNNLKDLYLDKGKKIIDKWKSKELPSAYYEGDDSLNPPYLPYSELDPYAKYNDYLNNI